MKNSVLDARGLMCPEPVSKAQLRLKELSSGSALTILATDPASHIDFEAFCLQTGHSFVSCEDSGQWLEIKLRKR